MANASKLEPGGAEAPGEEEGLDYGEQDLSTVFSRGSATWRSWSDIVRWLEKTGGRDALLSAEQADAMREDFAQLEKDGVPFVRDARQAYDLTHKERYRHVA